MYLVDLAYCGHGVSLKCLQTLDNFLVMLFLDRLRGTNVNAAPADTTNKGSHGGLTIGQGKNLAHLK